MTEAACVIEDEGDGLVLDEKTHRYSYQGRPVAGVTEILQGVGIVDPRWFSEFSRDRGKAVHLAMQLLIQGRLDWSTVDERIIGYVRAGESFCRDVGVVCGDPRNLTEHLVHSRAYGYAGKVDAFVWLFGKIPAEVDWKSGALGACHLQTAAYADPLQEELRLKRPLKRLGVKLNADGSYRVTEYKDCRDLAHFAAAALIYNHYHLPKRKDENDGNDSH